MITVITIIGPSPSYLEQKALALSQANTRAHPSESPSSSLSASPLPPAQAPPPCSHDHEPHVSGHQHDRRLEKPGLKRSDRPEDPEPHIWYACQHSSLIMCLEEHSCIVEQNTTY